MAQKLIKWRRRPSIQPPGHALAAAFVSGAAAFRKRGFIFDHTAWEVKVWDRLVALAALYSIVFVPMQMVFPELRRMYPAWAAVDGLLDAAFLVDVCVKARTNYMDHGYTISEPWRVLQRYASTWMVVDVLSSVPFDWIFAGLDSASSSFQVSQVMKLLVMLRAGRLIRIFEHIEGAGATAIRIFGFMGGFLLIGHWLGLLWHFIAITPLEQVSRVGTSGTYDPTYADDEHGRAWLWNLQDAARAQVLNGTSVIVGRTELYFLMTRYICSLYWSLNVMTSLKGLENHETRECFVENDGIFNPLAERLYTIFVFVMGAIFYSVIYGTIGQYVRMFYASGDRYRRRVDEINEFAYFHRLPKHLVKQIRAYVDFAFAVTKGINVDAISQQLPANLQLEIHIHLNKKMVEQVRIFTGFPKDFFNVLVTKLQPCVAISGDFVFYAGDVGKRMYFVKRGAVEVRLNGTVIKALKEGDYFGETALLTDQPRTADICAVCDCMLLSLSKEDLEGVLHAFPAAKARFEQSVRERAQDLTKKTKDQSFSFSSRRNSCAEGGGGGGSGEVARRNSIDEARRRDSINEALMNMSPGSKHELKEHELKELRDRCDAADAAASESRESESFNRGSRSPNPIKFSPLAARRQSGQPGSISRAAIAPEPMENTTNASENNSVTCSITTVTDMVTDLDNDSCTEDRSTAGSSTAAAYTAARPTSLDGADQAGGNSNSGSFFFRRRGSGVGLGLMSLPKAAASPKINKRRGSPRPGSGDPNRSSGDAPAGSALEWSNLLHAIESEGRRTREDVSRLSGRVEEMASQMAKMSERLSDLSRSTKNAQWLMNAGDP